MTRRPLCRNCGPRPSAAPQAMSRRDRPTKPLSRSGDWANRWYLKGDLDSFGLEAQRLFDEEKLRLVHVEMLS